MKKVAVCLSGCGVFDGTEIHEAVCTLLALDQAGAQALCCAPDVPQADVVDHLHQKAEKASRNVLVESARIARGEIKKISEVRAADIDALVFPGGFGAAKNLSDFASRGSGCSVNPEVDRLVREMLDARKPIGAICIAPAMLARILGHRSLKVQLTIGSDPGTAEAINAMGGVHCNCAVTETVTDEKNKVVTTPAYMLGKGPAEVYEGIRKLVGEVLRLAG